MVSAREMRCQKVKQQKVNDQIICANQSSNCTNNILESIQTNSDHQFTGYKAMQYNIM